MNEPQTLGILVHSGQYFEQVMHLTEAAWQKSKQVRLFLIGPGLALLQQFDFSRLSRMAQIFICQSTKSRTAFLDAEVLPTSIPLLSAGSFMDRFRRCDRQLLF